MISRNQIRQAAVQFLYGHSMDPSTAVDEAGMDAFWAILLEPNYSNLTKARVKAVEHLGRDYPNKVRVFKERLKELLGHWQGVVKAEPLKEALEDISSREDSLVAAIADARSARKNDPACESEEPVNAFVRLNVLNETLLQFRARFFDMLQDSPEYARMAVGLVKTMRGMQDVGMNIRSIENCQDGCANAELTNVVEMARDIEELKSEGGRLIADVLRHSDEVDELINGVLENFSKERISPVERAIIRIAVFELKYRKELPTAVIASEAIRLAERYSITQAPRFINGIVASVSRICRPETEAAAE